MQAVTGIVLAGGRSRRMGRPKALLPFGDATLLDRVVRRVAQVCPRVVVVVRDRTVLSGGDDRALLPTGAHSVLPAGEVVVDRFPGLGPLSGLHAGLLATETETAVCVACDLPLVRPALLRLLADLAAGYDAAVPVVGGRPQPVCAAYHRRVADAAAEILQGGGGAMRDLLSRLRVRLVGAADLRRADPDLLSFLDVNTPADYREALARAQREADLSGGAEVCGAGDALETGAGGTSRSNPL